MQLLPLATRRMIELLVLEVSGPAHREIALGELLYRLRADREGVPFYVGETLANHPELWTNNNPLGKRLALGTICEVLNYFSNEDQERLLRIYQRRLNQASLRIVQLEQDFTTSLTLPREILAAFDRELAALRLFAESLLELVSVQDYTDGLLTSVIEQLIKTAIGREERVALLLRRIKSRATTSSWNRLCCLASRSIETALTTEPVDESVLILTDPSMVRFSRAALESESFVTTAERFGAVLARNLLRDQDDSNDLH